MAIEGREGEKESRAMHLAHKTRRRKTYAKLKVFEVPEHRSWKKTMLEIDQAGWTLHPKTISPRPRPDMPEMH